MNRENGISEELRNMGSPLAGLPRKMPYHVPAGYFDHLSSSLPGSVNDSEMAAGWSKTMPFWIPDGYFEKLPDNLIAAITAGDSSARFVKELPYKTPTRYFEQLPAQVLAAAKTAVKPAKTAKVIPLHGRGIFRRVQWAAAAIFILFMSAGSYITFFSDRSSNSEKILASVPNNEIDDYLQRTYRLDADRIVGNNEITNLQLDNKEIIQYLNETGWDVIE